jgi:zinc protease
LIDFAGLKTGPRDAQFHDHITAARLDNGLKLAVLPDARTNLVTVTVRYEVGGADDPPDAAGLAHYVEHLLAEKPMRVDAGLDGNAMTLEDRTYFVASALDTQLDMLLDMAAGRFSVRCDDFDGAELAREKDVVIEELKLRSSSERVPLMPFVWGAGHPYARGPGGAAFTGVSRDQLCAFIDQHYGPATATLVVTGNVDASLVQHLRERFSKIPARPIAPREQLPQIAHDVVRAGVPGLDRATAAIIFHVPGQGGADDPAIDILNGMLWRLDRDAPVHVARTIVLGEERARVVVAYA